MGKNEPVSIADEVPFEIPDSWEWCRLGDIFYHNTGKALNASNQSGQLLEYITTSNLYWNRFELNSLRQMYFTDVEIDKCTATKGDLLVCEGGDIGRAAIWPFDYDIRIQNHIHRLRAYVPVCTEYYYYIFYLYKHVGWIGGKGIGIQGLSANALHSLLFPLPPIEEQQRIVERISEIEPYTEKYEIAESKLNTLNNGFPDQLKKSILQLAVQGKLVPQNPDDEPASILLERIRAEKERLIAEGKIKRDKNESVIFRRDNSHYEKRGKTETCIDEEIPFDVPESWQWVRLSSICSLITDPPYGGSEKTEVKNHFPADLASSETADLFMSVIMYRLKESGRAAVILPDGFLFGTDNAKVAIKKKLLSEFNLHTVIRMPHSVFAPYTSITTNILFFDHSKPTEETWFYRLDMPDGYKNFSKTKPMKLEHFRPAMEWWNNRQEITVDGFDKAKRFTVEELAARTYNIDLCGYPHEEEEILPPKELIQQYQEKRASLNADIDRILAQITEILGIDVTEDNQ